MARSPEPVQQQRGQQERRQVVEGPGQLDAVRAQLSRGVHGAGVVDENVQLRSAPVPRRPVCARLPATTGRRRTSPTVAPAAAAFVTRAVAILARVSLRPTIATLAPRAAKASAAARPMPLVAPVIRTCLPSRGGLSMGGQPSEASTLGGLPLDGAADRRDLIGRRRRP